MMCLKIGVLFEASLKKEAYHLGSIKGFLNFWKLPYSVVVFVWYGLCIAYVELVMETSGGPF